MALLSSMMDKAVARRKNISTRLMRINSVDTFLSLLEELEDIELRIKSSVDRRTFK